MIRFVIGLVIFWSAVLAAPQYDQDKMKVVIEGNDVLLTCKGKPGSACGWIKTEDDGSNSVIVSSQTGSTKDRYALIDSPERGECSLIIHEAQLEDSSILTCKISPDTQPIMTWKLTVETRNPEDIFARSRIREEGDKVFLNCEGTSGSNCMWTKVDADGSSSVVVASGGVVTTDRYTLTDEPEQGDCSLTITEASIEDTGTFTCKIWPQPKAAAFWTLEIIPGQQRKRHALNKRRRYVRMKKISGKILHGPDLDNLNILF